MAANDAVSMNVAENRQNVPMAIQENRAAVPMVVAEGGGTPGGLNGKADKVTGAAAGNLAGLDSTGNLTDSGKAPGDFLEAPAAAGSEGQVLTADGEGGASWQDPTGGDPTEIIDDNAGSGDTDKVWSADKSHELLTEITNCNNTLDGVLTTSDNMFDGVFVQNEQVATSSGAFVAGNGYMRSGHIPISSGVVTVGVQANDIGDSITIATHYCFYDTSFAKVTAGNGNAFTIYTADDMKYQQFAVPTGAVYFAFDASIFYFGNKNWYVSQEQNPEGYVPYSATKNKVKPESIKVDKHLSQSGIPADAKVVGSKLNKDGNAIAAIRGGNPAIVKAASLAQGEGMYSVRNSVNKNKTYIFNAKVPSDSWSILVAHSPVDSSFDSNTYSQGFIITPTTATAWTNGNNGEGGTLGSVWNHGLTIEARLTVIISVGRDGLFTLYLMSENGLVHKDYSYVYTGRKGTIYAKSLAGTFTDAELSFGCSDLEKPVWIFGDSYMQIAEASWPYWLIQTKMDNFLMNSYPGEATTNALLDLKSLLTIATPRFIVWAQGMNDHDTSSAVNSTWLEGVEELIEICESKGITLILAKIPNVAHTSYNNVKKNAWVQASGYRYVDFNKAIGAADEPGATWPEGWLSNDNVHPTEMGARVLAGQIMLDVPELTMP